MISHLILFYLVYLYDIKFNVGADVVTQVATKRINWSSYHIDSKKDNIGTLLRHMM